MSTPDELSAEREREIRARLTVITPGPWHGEHAPGLHDCAIIGDDGWITPGPSGPEYGVDSMQGRADAEFIAHAPADVATLLAEVERLRAELAARPSRGEVLREAYAEVETALAAELDDGRAVTLYEMLLLLGALQPHTCARSQGLHSRDCPSYVPGHEQLSRENGLRAYRRERACRVLQDWSVSWPGYAPVDITPVELRPDAKLEKTFGPHWAEVVQLVRQAATLTPHQVQQIHAARSAALDSARDAARDAALDAALDDPADDPLDAVLHAAKDAALNATRGAARDAAVDAAGYAALAIVAQGSISEEHHRALMGPWRAAFPDA